MLTAEDTSSLFTHNVVQYFSQITIQGQMDITTSFFISENIDSCQSPRAF